MNKYAYWCFRLFPKIKVEYYKHWNKLYFKLLGIKYGTNLNVYNRVYILGYGKIVIGSNFCFSSGDSINSICRNIRGTIHTMAKEATIEIGNNVGISSVCIRAMKKVTIGSNVNIGGDCLIMDNDAHPHNYLFRRDSYIKGVPEELYANLIPASPVLISDDVWIGARCQILKGVHIGPRSIIASGSIVTKDIPADVIAGGVPCKVIKNLRDNDKGCSNYYSI